MIKNILSVVMATGVIVLSCREHPSPIDRKIAEQKDTVIDINLEAPSVKSDDYDSNVTGDSVPRAIQQQFPPDYILLFAASGDLNKDSVADCLVVLKHIMEDSVDLNDDVQFARKLLIFIGRGNNNFELAAASDSAMYCKTCGGMMGDPFMGFTIKNGYFSIENYGGSGWRWSRTITFKYVPEKKNWYLHKDGHQSFHASDPEKVTTTILTPKDFGVVSFAQFNINKDE